MILRIRIAGAEFEVGARASALLSSYCAFMVAWTAADLSFSFFSSAFPSAVGPERVRRGILYIERIFFTDDEFHA
jgi:hypothetical protein